MRTEAAMMAVALVFSAPLTGCEEGPNGPDASVAEAGIDSGPGDASELDANQPRDAAGGDGATRYDGGSDAGGGTAGSSGGPDDPHLCQGPMPDPVGDVCLSCLLEHCCGWGSGACLAPLGTHLRRDGGAGDCYHGYFIGCVRTCFENEVAEGSTVDSWQIVANCSLECSFATEPPPESFPSDVNSPGEFLVLCAIGSEPEASSEADGGADDDAGSTCRVTSRCNYPQSPCVRECFPSWR